MKFRGAEHGTHHPHHHIMHHGRAHGPPGPVRQEPEEAGPGADGAAGHYDLLLFGLPSPSRLWRTGVGGIRDRGVA